jgi:hypothetical protein
VALETNITTYLLELTKDEAFIVGNLVVVAFTGWFLDVLAPFLFYMTSIHVKYP